MMHDPTSVRTITVMVVDDNPVVRSGLGNLLDGEDDITVVATAADGAEGIRLVRQHKPDVTLMDVRMPVMDGLEAATAVSGTTRVVMLTSTEDVPVVTRALGLGIWGYLVHGAFDPASLAGMIRDVSLGRSHMSPGPTATVLAQARNRRDRRAELVGSAGLSERETEVLDAVAAGLSNHEVAARLFLSPKTVKNHLNRIFAKLGVESRAQAMALWLGTSLD